MAEGAALHEELGAAPPPAVLRALGDEEAEDLAQALGEARRRQRRELRAALAGAYDHVPRLLRAPLRKVLGG